MGTGDQFNLSLLAFPGDGGMGLRILPSNLALIFPITSLILQLPVSPATSKIICTQKILLQLWRFPKVFKAVEQETKYT